MTEFLLQARIRLTPADAAGHMLLLLAEVNVFGGVIDFDRV